jgi:hypothetical protein
MAQRVGSWAVALGRENLPESMVEVILFERIIANTEKRPQVPLGHELGLDLEAGCNEMAGETAAEHIADRAIGVVEPP